MDTPQGAKLEITTEYAILLVGQTVHLPPTGYLAWSRICFTEGGGGQGRIRKFRKKI